MRVPVRIVLGDADKVAPPATNGEVAAGLIPGAKLTVLPHVGHYDFLAECTPAGNATVPVCPTEVPRTETHKTAIDEALAFFDATLGAAP
jgi:pimeloyl-ACP methyl ester carboxylesterase